MEIENTLQKVELKVSLHKRNRAADFSIQRHDYKEVFFLVRAKAGQIFQKGDNYQAILHGKYTKTEAPHIHIGRYEEGDKDYGKGVLFFEEGTTEEGRGGPGNARSSTTGQCGRLNGPSPV